MDSATMVGLITLLTPGITGVIKRFIPYSYEKAFKRFIPVIRKTDFDRHFPIMRNDPLGHGVSSMDQQKICKAKSKRTGKQCERIVTPGYDVCHYHGANPQNHGGPPKQNKNSMTYGAYVNKILDDEEQEIFDEFYNQLNEDFVLNKSSDAMSAQMACIYFVRLIRAIKGNNAETMNKVDLLLSRKLSELKATKDKREGETINLNTTPAEWAANLLEKVRRARTENEQEEKAETDKTEK